jgi:hypothetical protein
MSSHAFTTKPRIRQTWKSSPESSARSLATVNSRIYQCHDLTTKICRPTGRAGAGLIHPGVHGLGEDQARVFDVDRRQAFPYQSPSLHFCTGRRGDIERALIYLPYMIIRVIHYPATLRHLTGADLLTHRPPLRRKAESHLSPASDVPAGHVVHLVRLREKLAGTFRSRY